MAATEKLKIDGAAKRFLDEDKLQNLSDLSNFLIDNKLTPRDTKSGGTWAVKYKNKSVCHIRLNDKEARWNVSFSHFTREKWFVDYDKYIIDDEVIKFVWDNIQAPLCIARGVKDDCWSKNNKMTILGKRFGAVCNCVGFRIYDPSETDIEILKKLILIIRNYIVDLETARKT